ncbi:MAG: hypothetical protein JW909_04500 [Planctomycetes bacterium]|nr:hypothetical protein [Planctomycetota bacterium]
MGPNMAGGYGGWLSDAVLGEGPAGMSYRTGRYASLEEWREAGRKRVLECMAPVDLGGTPEARVEESGVHDGVEVEYLTWQLACGPRTEAVFMKPAGEAGPLPGVLGLHDHGGNKYMGWRKISRTDGDPWKVQAEHQERYYGGAGWATELARRGYGVLVHDTFPFASRRVRVADVPEAIRRGGVDPEGDDAEAIAKYNGFAGRHETEMEKSLLCAGTTWPGVYVVEDMRALDVLCGRAEVDAGRVGCGGLSGGGMRTAYLAGLDERVRCCACVGFMTTWRDFLLYKNWTHTWMAYTPLVPRDLDFPEILALRAPAATMVQNTTEDELYTLSEVKRAFGILEETFGKGGAGEMLKCELYPGPHKFDLEMQASAFEWFDRHLSRRS